VVFFVFNVKIGGAESHGAIDVNGQARDALLIFQLAQVVHEGLRAADGERGNDDGATAFGDAIDDLGEEFRRDRRGRVRGHRRWIRKSEHQPRREALRDLSGSAGSSGRCRRKRG